MQLSIMEYPSAMKRKEVLLHATGVTNLENIMLREIIRHRKINNA